MILLLDTSTSICRLGLVEFGEITWHEWEANRELAKGLLKYCNDTLTEHEKVWSDIEGIGVFKGPGSFTGLRIGLTVMNTLADSLNVPIVGATGSEWVEDITSALAKGANDRVVLPEYGSDAHITKPRK